MNMTDNLPIDELFHREYGHRGSSIYRYFAPGRVNLIGEHIDYNGGFVFPAALSLGIWSALRFRTDNKVCLKSLNAPLALTMDLNDTVEYDEQAGWGNYPRGIIKYLRNSGYSLRGCDILYAGNLPDGAGLSSSAALLTLTAFMLMHVNGNTVIDRVELARFCQQVENEFINVKCGIMDQFSIALGRQGNAILLDCQTLAYQYIPFVLSQHSLVIMNTNKKRELAESKYNQRRSECEQALGIIRQHRALASLCQATLPELEMYLTDETLYRRARHVVSENLRVQEAVKQLKQENIAAFGKLLTETHQSLMHDYEVSGPELDAIVYHALQHSGCIGARMTGAGFGGCAFALVETGRVDAFMQAVSQGYRQSIGREASFYVAGIGDGVKLLGC